MTNTIYVRTHVRTYTEETRSHICTHAHYVRDRRWYPTRQPPTLRTGYSLPAISRCRDLLTTTCSARNSEDTRLALTIGSRKTQDSPTRSDMLIIMISEHSLLQSLFTELGSLQVRQLVVRAVTALEQTQLLYHRIPFFLCKSLSVDLLSTHAIVFYDLLETIYLVPDRTYLGKLRTSLPHVVTQTILKIGSYPWMLSSFWHGYLGKFLNADIAQVSSV